MLVNVYRVDYCKLFRLLIRRDIPSMHLRLLFNMYTNSVAHVRWNFGVFNNSFSVLNCVKARRYCQSCPLL